MTEDPRYPEGFDTPAKSADIRDGSKIGDTKK